MKKKQHKTMSQLSNMYVVEYTHEIKNKMRFSSINDLLVKYNVSAI